MFAKIINGEIYFAQRIIKVGDDTIVHPTQKQLEQLGYLPVQFTEQPASIEGYCYEPTWEEKNGVILQGWNLVESKEDIDDTEALNIILGGAE